MNFITVTETTVYSRQILVNPKHISMIKEYEGIVNIVNIVINDRFIQIKESMEQLMSLIKGVS